MDTECIPAVWFAVSSTFVTFNRIYKSVLFAFSVEVFCNSISALCAASICNKRLPSYVTFIYGLRVLAFGSCILYTVDIFLVFVSVFCISWYFHLITTKLCLFTWTDDAPISIIILLLLLLLLLLAT